MNEVILIKLLNEGIPFSLLIVLGVALYRGLKKNQILLTNREDLLKRYLLFRSDRQVRLKVHEEDEKIHQELLKSLSNSWKNFKKAYDQCLHSLVRNTARTKHFLQLITLGLLINSGRLLADEYYFYGFETRFFLAGARELSTYVVVVLGFLLLKTQTRPFLPLKGETVKMDREILFFPNQLSAEGDHEFLYDVFDPIEGAGGEDGPEDPHPHR